MQSVEKVFLPLSKRLGIFLSNLSLLSILIGLFYCFILTASDKITFDYIFLFGLPIIILFIGIVVASIIYTIIHIWCLKVSFFFTDEKGDTWKIERAVNKSTILASRDKHKYRYFELKNVKQKELTKKLNKEEKIFGEKFKHPVSWFLGAVVGYLLLAFYISNEGFDGVTIIQFGGICSLVFTIISSFLLVIYNNQKVSKEF
ncbi:hypothetical protein [Lysinibacillus sp. BPa_S21]|uniref:hypothetical protein n=1 Tax=Lysinibacillus sp. BPa_S21 TaxID=2932478 RepID=UPI002012F5C7|nr:hypothetical protein [Lysinibacillus sp. BPa_S21]MCL1695159.1 hypothetical protein [Lysinibacillus sp. BPa_S21]